MTSHRSRVRPRHQLALLAVAALVAAMAGPAAASGATGRPTAIVAMGDSISAGEGGGDYTPDSDRFGRYCHRSPAASINHAKPAGVTTAVNLACSAATTDDVRLGGARRYGEPPQAEQLKSVARKYTVRSIVLTVGANDISTVNMVIGCVLAYGVGQSCSPGLGRWLPQRLTAIQPRIITDLHDIRTVMRAAGYDDGSYELVLQSYPSPSSGASRYSTIWRALQGCPFQDQDIVWIHRTGFPMINRYMRTAAESVPGVRFLGLSGALDGRQACSRGIGHDQEWMWGLFVDLAGLRNGPGPQLVSQSLHPNAVGYRYLAWCLGRFHESPTRSAHCMRGVDGRMHLAADS